MHAALTTLAEFFSVLNLFLFHSFLKISLKNCAGRPLSRTQNAVRHGLFRISVHCFPNTFHLIPSRNFQVFTSLQKLRFQPCIIPKLKLLFKSTILDIRLHVYSRENSVSMMGCRVSPFPGICLQHWSTDHVLVGGAPMVFSVMIAPSHTPTRVCRICCSPCRPHQSLFIPSL